MDELDHYPYTGHSTIVGNMKCAFLRTDEILAYFSKRKRRALKLYKEFILAGCHEKQRKELTGGGLKRSLKGMGVNPEADKNQEAYDERILGSGEFVETILKESKNYKPKKNRIGLDELINRVCRCTGIDVNELLSEGRLKHISNTRAIICYLGIRCLGFSASILSHTLSIGHSSVIAATERGKQLVSKERLEEKILGQ
jgi:hypothetical protein